MSSRELKRLERQVATLKRQLDTASASLVNVTEILGAVMAGHDGTVSNASTTRAARAKAVDKPTAKTDKPTAKTDKAAASDRTSKSSSRSSSTKGSSEDKTSKSSSRSSSKKRD